MLANAKWTQNSNVFLRIYAQAKSICRCFKKGKASCHFKYNLDDKICVKGRLKLNVWDPICFGSAMPNIMGFASISLLFLSGFCFRTKNCNQKIHGKYLWEKEKGGHVSCLQTFPHWLSWVLVTQLALCMESIADEYPTYFRPEFEYFIAGNISWTFVRLPLFFPYPAIKSNMAMMIFAKSLTKIKLFTNTGVLWNLRWGRFTSKKKMWTYFHITTFGNSTTFDQRNSFCTFIIRWTDFRIVMSCTTKIVL